MRIAQLLPSLEVGGLERLAVDLAKQQKAEGHEPFLYCTCRSGPLAEEAESAHIPTHVFGKTDGISPRLVWQLAAQMRRDKPDVLHTHNALVLHYGIAAARLAGIGAVVNTRHGGSQKDPRSELLWSRMVPWTNAVVFVSEGARREFVCRRKNTHDNTRVIYNGIRVETFTSKPALPASRLPRFCFGTVGRLVPAKDHVTLTRAFARVAANWPEAELHIAGEGPCRAEIVETAVSLGIAERVKLYGAVVDVAGFLAGLDLFVLSSIREGLPIVLEEAMAAGLPIVSTRLPGLDELAPESRVAWFCPPAEPEKLAQIMSDVARRSDLRLIGENARRLAMKFGIQETWRQYHRLFEEILDQRRHN